MKIAQSSRRFLISFRKSADFQTELLDADNHRDQVLVEAQSDSNHILVKVEESLMVTGRCTAAEHNEGTLTAVLLDSTEHDRAVLTA